MKKLLLHVCCAPCACWPIEQLEKQYQLTAYFYNPNIQPREEYGKRLAELKKYLDKINIPLIEGPYEDQKWFELCEPYKDEPEKGRRCDLCYQLRLEKTAECAKQNNFDCFATDLTVSPHKKTAKINEIGKELERQFKVKYLESDWKKQEGFKHSCEISKQEKFYRQNYCGCIYSKIKGRG